MPSPPVTPSATTRPRLIVGLGASAGGLDPLEVFFRHIPVDTGMAFVVVQHLSPDYPSLMHELLGRYTQLPIQRVTDAMPVEANNVYLIPARMTMTIQGGVLQLSPQDREGDQPPMPIDAFFNALAADAGERAAAVVLSGTGTDGSRGVKQIKSAGGLVLVQDAETARFTGMPRAAQDTGVVDATLPPEKIVARLLRHLDNPGRDRAEPIVDPSLELEGIDAVLSLLDQAHNIDFTLYKPATVRRRIERRVMLDGTGDLEAYLRRLRDDPDELLQLYRDLLIGVTELFRDPAAFASLKTGAVTDLLRAKADGDELRVWVCGCATGEEAYSVAILLDEVRRELGRPQHPIRVFATDAHRKSVEQASAGRYAVTALQHVSDERRERYFERRTDHFIVRSKLRQMVTFAPQNMITDPPFTRMDLVSCRNVLIYFRNDVQSRVISLFHFSLNVGGCLFLGPSETTQPYHDEFEPIDPHWRIYRKRRSVRLLPATRLPTHTPTPVPRRRSGAAALPAPASLPNASLLAAYDVLLEDCMQAAVLVNADRQLVHVFGNAGELIHTPAGRITGDVVALFDGDLRIAVAAALRKTDEDGGRVSVGTVRVDGDRAVRVRARALPGAGTGTPKYSVVWFEPVEPRTDAAAAAADDGAPAPGFGPVADGFAADPAAAETLRGLERELHETRAKLQATVEELETANEELNAANEEMVASNEELQSTNEELHSVNEELYTVNAEYQEKITELTRLTDDVNNLLASTAIGTVFLDGDLYLRRFTPAVRDLMHVRTSDLGRPFDEISRTFVYPELIDDARGVLRTGQTQQRACEAEDGRSLLVRLNPYLTAAGDITGLVITLVDVSSLKRAERKVDQERRLTQEVLDAVPSMVVLKDNENHLIRVNRVFADSLNLPREDIEGRAAREFFGDDADAYFEDDREVIESGQPKLGILETMRDGEGAVRQIRTDKIPLFDDDTGEPRGVVVVITDVSDLHLARAELEAARDRLELALRAANAGLWEWDLRTQEVYYNDTYFTMLGYEPGELPGTYDTWRDLCHPDDLDGARRAVDAYLSGDAPAYNHPHRLRRKDGRYHWVLAKGEIFERGNDQAVRRVCGLHLDIDDIKRAEAELADSNAELENRVRRRTEELTHTRDELEDHVRRRTGELEERNEQLDQFARVASHDLRSPLRTIIGFSDHLRDIHADAFDPAAEPGDRPPRRDEARDALDRINSAARRMSSLVDSLLTFASVGRSDITPVPVDLSDLTQQVLQDLGPEIASANAKVEIAPPLPTVLGDPSLLRQVMQNLIDNAVKYRGDDPPEIHVSAENEADPAADGRSPMTTVRVRDNGMGFDAADAQRAFEPFQRLYRGGDRRGSGIGLSICRRVVERHGGRITVDTTRGGGSTFAFTLPLHAPENPT